MNDDLIIDILLDVGLVNRTQVEEGREKAATAGSSVVDALIGAGHLARPDLLQAVASAYGMEVVSLNGRQFSKEVIDAVPAHVAKRYKVMPVHTTEHSVMIALSEPDDLDLVETLRHILHKHVDPVVASAEEIDAAVTNYYGTLADMDRIVTDMTEGDAVATRADATFDEDEGDQKEDSAVVRLVMKFLTDAQRRRASDIHVEPLEKKIRVRYRIDGVLVEVDNPHKRLQGAIINRIKIMSRMSIAEKRIPQDGRIQFLYEGKPIDLRVSTVPTVHGESIVMRILDKSGLTLGLPQLGFLSDDQATFEKLITLPDGIILVTGPTGSGKTTTLYGCLNYMNKPDRKIMTVEDPVEYEMSGINQVAVREDIGMTFSMALRSILRQAPNIIMIGEIRDLETANIAVNASLTGHLVLSTLHTNDAPSAITRLIDIGVKPFLCASSIRAIMAQRLVRKVCANCSAPYTPTEAEINSLRIPEAQLSSATFKKGAGCEKCNGSGYKGRMGIFEVFLINDEIRRMIFDKTGASILRQRARELGMRTLREDGMRKVLGGLTTPEEVISITMGDKE
ncbi:MAG: ATPase, T2SS/T4P/T4SS family [Verrucomicrobiae bacterium]|nr:ATPase, T2SS/T4P/T4SS family [Verrucomicrobiae bacterium]